MLLFHCTKSGDACPAHDACHLPRPRLAIMTNTPTSRKAGRGVACRHCSNISGSPWRVIPYWIAVAAQTWSEARAALIWWHLPFLTLKTPGLHGRNLLRLLCESTCWSDLQKTLSRRQGRARFWRSSPSSCSIVNGQNSHG